MKGVPAREAPLPHHATCAAAACGPGVDRAGAAGRLAGISPGAPAAPAGVGGCPRKEDLP